ncbi:hypothetical protein ig2599ANME_0910 [groundwater metagenome]
MYYIYGLVVASILLLSVMIKYRSKKIQGEWVLAGFLIGIFSLPLGLFLTPVIEIITRLFLPEGGLNQIFSVLLMSILLSICYTYLKKGSVYLFIKVAAVSIVMLFLVIAAWFSISMGEGGLFISIQKFDTVEEILGANPSLEKVEITEKELDEYPGIKKAISVCRSVDTCSSKVDPAEWNIRDLIQEKARQLGYLFHFTDADLEEQMRKFKLGDDVPISAKLKSTFESRGFSISGDAFIYHADNRWDIIENQQKSYEIWKEDGELHVYEGKYHNPYFKIGEKYYLLSFYWAD